ncbi:MAG: WG repeat-containing protein [Bacteroidetes bacterium]|nr:MAG: WG repeat-containing protein [Bacteroidota bacterium]TAG86647.1 MAG: WG repeat-containing protein [Bacteroidota bacterium]
MKKIFLLLLFFVFNFGLNAQNPFFPIKKSNQWSYIDLKGKEVLKINANLTNLGNFYEGLAAVQDEKTKKYGYIDTKGQWAIKPIYEAAGYFDKGMAIVMLACDENCLKEGEGLMNFFYTLLIDKTGKVVLRDNSQDTEPYKRFWFADFNQEERLVAIWGLGVGDFKSLMNRKGEVISDRIVSMSKLEIVDGLAACRSIKPSYIDKSGKKVIDASMYNFIRDFSNGYAWLDLTTEIKGKTDKDGQPMLKEELVLIDKKGKQVLKFSKDDYSFAREVGEGLFPMILKEEISDSRRTIFMNLKGQKALPKTYKEAQSFKNGLAFVKEINDSFGYIDKRGKFVIELSAENFNLENTMFGDFNAGGYAFIYERDVVFDNVFVKGILLKNGQYFPKFVTE